MLAEVKVDFAALPPLVKGGSPTFSVVLLSCGVVLCLAREGFLAVGFALAVPAASEVPSGFPFGPLGVWDLCVLCLVMYILLLLT